MVEMSEQDRVELILNRQVSPKLTEITSKLDTLNSSVQYISNQYVEEKLEHRRQIQELSGAIEDLRKILNGNGKVGLVAQVDSLKSWVGDQKRLQWVIIGAVIAELVGLGFVLFEHVLIPVP